MHGPLEQVRELGSAAGQLWLPSRDVTELPVVQPDISRVAVLLNRNARKVTDDMARHIERVVGRGNLYYSGSLEEAESYVREIVQRGYGTVVCGGGDGTFAQTVNMVLRYIDEANAWRLQRHRRFGERQSLLGRPRFALLRLGTGNAISGMMGAGDPRDDVRHLVDYVPTQTHSIPLIEQDGERFFFAGMGYDSTLLNDYNWLKERTKHRMMKSVAHGMTGYFAALFSRTLPRVAAGEHPELTVRVRAAGRAYYVDPRRDDECVELEPGSLLYEGPASFIGAATTQFYGYGFKMFPFARLRPDTLHLRVARLGALGCLANLPSLWRGTHRSPDQLFDFLAEQVQVELSQPFPFQHSGEASGKRDALDLRVSEDRLDIVDLHRARRLS